jgi:site-specific recombinase XerD
LTCSAKRTKKAFRSLPQKIDLRGYSKRSIKDYPYNMRHFMRYLEEKENVQSLSQVTPQHLTAYHAYLQYAQFRKGKHLATVSVIKRLEAVRLFYKIMFAEKLIFLCIRRLPYVYFSIVFERALFYRELL